MKDKRGYFITPPQGNPVSVLYSLAAVSRRLDGLPCNETLWETLPPLWLGCELAVICQYLQILHYTHTQMHARIRTHFHLGIMAQRLCLHQGRGEGEVWAWQFSNPEADPEIYTRVPTGRLTALSTVLNTLCTWFDPQGDCATLPGWNWTNLTRLNPPPSHQ